MQHSGSTTRQLLILQRLLAGRAATALGLSPSGAQDLSLATLVTILEEYVEFQKREEGASELEAKAMREGIFTRDELLRMTAEERTDAHAALELLRELERLDAPRTPRLSELARGEAHEWPPELIHVVSKLVAVVASQEESLALMRAELGDLRSERMGTGDTPPLSLLPRAPHERIEPGVEVGIAAASESPTIHTRETLSSGLAPYGGQRETVAEIESIVSYISALGASRNMSLLPLHERSAAMSRADVRDRTKAFRRGQR